MRPLNPNQIWNSVSNVIQETFTWTDDFFCVRSDGICAGCLLSVHVQYSILFFAKDKRKRKHFIRIIAIYTQSLFIIKNLRNLQSRPTFAYEEDRNVLVVLWGCGVEVDLAVLCCWLDSVLLEDFSSSNGSLILLLLPAFCSTKTYFCIFSFSACFIQPSLACPAFPGTVQCCTTPAGEELAWALLTLLLLLVQLQRCQQHS